LIGVGRKHGFAIGSSKTETVRPFGQVAGYQGQQELFNGEVRFTLPASEMIQQYEELKPQIATYLLSKKS